MARSRNIKPSFFTNEILGTQDPIIGMTFIGLWCLADRTGTLEDRPLRIKAELFPYRENLDVNGYLTVLERLRFIDRYVVEGVGYIHVLNFEKHQTPHHTEKAKNHPAKPLIVKHSDDLTVKKQLPDGEKTVATRSDLLIPDSLIPDSKNKPPRLPSLDIPPGFDAFWSAYDKKVERPAAERAWKKAGITEVMLPTVIAAVRAYVSVTPDKTFRKNPATWLNNRCWNDEVIKPIAPGGTKQLPAAENFDTRDYGTGGRMK